MGTRSLNRVGLAAALTLALGMGCGDDDGGQNDNQNENQNNNNAGDVCGDGVVQGAEECDDGALNSDSAADACRTDCRHSWCGDGVNDASELCDDGPANSDAVPDACRADCTPPGCGDDVVDVQAGETCDDGNQTEGDGCNPTCQVEYCGNGVVDPGEVCDDGNYAGGDGCGPACNSLEICGNGVVDVTAHPPEQCDDGNHRSHDGCSSGCVAEFPSWVLHEPSLGGLRSHGMVYDSHRDRLVVFGGEGFCGPFCDQTFEFDGQRWRRVITATTPPGRQKLAMVYDHVRQVVVLFGGEQVSILGDTWEYDGTDWRQVTTAHAPSARAEPRLTYDSQRGVVVLFGGGYDPGTGSVTRLGDTWEYDGSDWAERTPANPAPSPAARMGHSMAYDPDRGVTVLAGGSVDGNGMDETWEWDGTQWTLQNPASGVGGTAGMAYDEARGVMVLMVESDSTTCATDLCLEAFELDSDPGSYGWVETGHQLPGLRSRFGLAYDSIRERTLLFGGEDQARVATDDTWAYNGTAWSDVSPATTPEPRAQSAMAYDSQRGEVVMFGGGAESLNPNFFAPAITWRFDREGWLGEDLPGSPPPLAGHAMAYDPQRDRVVLFGGAYDPGGMGNEVTAIDWTWEYDGTGWVEVSPLHRPAARTGHRLVYDANLGGILLFGGVQGVTVGIGAENDTWLYDGTDWTELNVAQAPPARIYHMLAYDEARQEAVLHTGISATATVLPDTWVFDGTTWTERTPPASPPWRAVAAMDFDPLRQQVVLFGGVQLSGYYRDVWEWDGSAWTRAYALPPPARGYTGMVYHRGLKQIVLFGGYNGSVLGDTWLYQYASDWPDEVCHNGADDDGDGDVDCADPDCEEQPCGGGGVCEAGVCVTP